MNGKLGICYILSNVRLWQDSKLRCFVSTSHSLQRTIKGSKEETLRLDLSIVCIIGQESCRFTVWHFLIFSKHSGFKSLLSFCNYQIIFSIIEIIIFACSFSSFIWPQGMTQIIKTDIIMSGWSLWVHLVHWMEITTWIVIFITSNKVCYNVITKLIH